MGLDPIESFSRQLRLLSDLAPAVYSKLAELMTAMVHSTLCQSGPRCSVHHLPCFCKLELTWLLSIIQTSGRLAAGKHISLHRHVTVNHSEADILPAANVEGPMKRQPN